MCEKSCGRDWSGDVVVCMNQHVRSDLPGIVRAREMWAGPGEHRGEANGHGALCVQTPGGLLGVKPAEVSWWRYAGETRRYVWSVQRHHWVPADELHVQLAEVVAGQASGIPGPTMAEVQP